MNHFHKEDSNAGPQDLIESCLRPIGHSAEEDFKSSSFHFQREERVLKEEMETCLTLTQAEISTNFPVSLSLSLSLSLALCVPHETEIGTFVLSSLTSLVH